MKKNKIIFLSTTLALLSLVLITVGVTYTFFNYKATGSTLSTITSGGITFHYREIDGIGHGISITDALPVRDNDDAKTSNDYFSFKITSTTRGDNIKIPYVVTARMTSDTIMGNIVDIYLTDENNNPTSIFEGNLIKYNELEDYNNNSNEKIIYTDTVTISDYEKDFRLRMWIDQNTNLNTGNGTSNYNDKEFSITVNVYAEGKIEKLAKDIILKNRTIKTTNPTLNKTSQEANENGIYKVNVDGIGYGGSTTGGTTYVFRGDVRDNVVEFSKDINNKPYIWRIVRINEDGTIRLVLDAYIQGNNFNPYSADTFSYTNTGSMYYSNATGTGYMSFVKIKVEEWYDNNIDKLVTGSTTKKYSDYVATGDYFCEAAKVSYDETHITNAGVQSMETYDNYVSDLKCELYYCNNTQVSKSEYINCNNENKEIKSVDKNGKGLLNNHISLLSYEEANYAGASTEENREYYLYKGVTTNNDWAWWTTSPAGIDSDMAMGWQVQRGKLKGDYFYWCYGSICHVADARPVINLKADTQLEWDETTSRYKVIY